MKDVYQVNGVEETWAVARAFAAELRPGDVVCLEGDLGAGKTTFTQGLAASLGAKRAVTSPRSASSSSIRRTASCSSTWISTVSTTRTTC